MTRRKLTTKEKIKIINNDFKLWNSNFVKIVDNNQDLIPFEFTNEQNHLYENADKRNLILKSRQSGFSTFCLSYLLFTCITRQNSMCITLAHKGNTVAKNFEMIKTMYYNLNDLAIPDGYTKDNFIVRMNRNEIKFANGSSIINDTAGNKEIRGFTFQAIHLSEFAHFNHLNQTDGLTAIEFALAKNSESKIFIETTAQGMNEFFEMYTRAEKGRSRYKAFFYEWYKNDLYASEYDEAEKLYKAQNKGRPLARADLTEYEKGLHDKGCTLKKLSYRRIQLQDMSEELFKQEMPSNSTECFVNSSGSVFDTNLIAERINNLVPPLKLNEIVDLPLSLQKYVNDGLYIYDNPEPNKRYYAGIDTASGLGGATDNSAINIVDSDGKQVCVFYRNSLAIYRLVDVVEELGLYYNYAMLLVERATFGIDLLHRLRNDKRYINLLKTRSVDKITGRAVYKHGYATTQVSKAKMVGDLKENFELGGVFIQDRETLNEMKIFTDSDGKLGNKGGGRDDLVDSLALAIQCLKTRKSYL